jgi:molybdopterin molybdotransferase
MYSVAEARERILSHFTPVATETIPLEDSAGRVLAVDLTATHDLPPFDNSSMDGFALRSEDGAGADSNAPVTLRVVDDIPAGSSPNTAIARGESARIMTGAPMPPGADAVIPVEDTDFTVRAAGTPAPPTVSFNRRVTAGENVRRQGMDIRMGEIVLKKGRALDPQDLGLLAMLGYGRVEAHARPRIALLSSGDELLHVGEPLEGAKIRDSNSYMLAAMAEKAGAVVLRLGVAGDSRQSVSALLEQAAALGVDLILSSAGVSVGAFDFIKEVIDSHGRLDFWRVNMRPGKPLAFGEYRGVDFIGLPGNPVSAFVCFEVFVRPVLDRLGGRAQAGRRTVRVLCGEQIDSDGRESYLRATLHETDGVRTAQLAGHQGSGNLLSLVQADALLIIPAGVKCVPAGRELEAVLL